MHTLYRIFWIFIVFSSQYLTADEQYYYVEDCEVEQENCCQQEYIYYYPRFKMTQSSSHPYILNQQDNSAWPGKRGGDFIDIFSR